MVEIELKFQIKPKDAQKIIKLLKKAGYLVTQERTYEKTVMYDNPQRIMQKTDGRVRLRVSGKRSELSYKKPLTRDGVKKEIEYEAVVLNPDAIEKILEMMEFNPTTSYERYRTALKKDHIKVTVDEYPFANFIEIEGEEKEIKNLAKKLGFSLRDNLTDSCDTLFQRWRKGKGLPFKPHMLFKDHDK